MHIVNNYVRTRGLALVPQSVFEHSVDNNLFQLCKPPSKRHAGTRLRQVPLFPMLAAVFHRRTSVARGLPRLSLGENIERSIIRSSDPMGTPLLPMKETLVRRTFRIKLQSQACISAFCKLEKYKPELALRAMRLMTKKSAAGVKLRAVCMLAGPFSVKMYEPIGQSRNIKLPSMQIKTNVISMDITSASVSFGTVEYAPKVRKWLRWEIYTAVQEMAAAGKRQAASCSKSSCCSRWRPICTTRRSRSSRSGRSSNELCRP